MMGEVFENAGEFGEQPTPTGPNEPAFSQEERGQIPAQFVTVLPYMTPEQQARLAGLQAGRATMWFESALTGQRSRELPVVAFATSGKTFMEQAAMVTGVGGWLTAYVKPNDGGENEDFFFGFDAPQVASNAKQQGGSPFDDVERLVKLMALLQGSGNPMQAMQQNMAAMFGMFGLMQQMAGKLVPKQEESTDLGSILKLVELGKGALFGEKQAGGAVSGGMGGTGGGSDPDALDTGALVPAA